jgi:hypothetical protein
MFTVSGELGTSPEFCPLVSLLLLYLMLASVIWLTILSSSLYRLMHGLVIASSQ